MNIPEILVANGTGIILVVFLFLLRVRNSETKQTGAVLYDGMLAVTLVALVTETSSFLIDGGLSYARCPYQYPLHRFHRFGGLFVVPVRGFPYLPQHPAAAPENPDAGHSAPPHTDSHGHQPVRHRAHLPRLSRKCLLSRPAEFSPLCHAVPLLCREYLSSHPLQTDRHYH